MGAVNTTYTFQANDTITSAKMNDIIDQTVLTNSALEGTTLAVTTGGQLKVNSQGITSNELASNSVTQAKLSTLPGEIGASWQSYTPVFTLGGPATNGNAVITGNYIKIGKTIHYRISYVLGSATNYTGLTSITASLPTTPNSSYDPGVPMGTAIYITGNSTTVTGYYPGYCFYSFGVNIVLTGIFVSSTNSISALAGFDATNPNLVPPFQALPTNKILITGTYETA